MPPVNKSDFPYPLRTVDGTMSVSIDAVGATLPNENVETDAGNQLVSVPNTGTGYNVKQNTPFLITPQLGAATANTLVVNNLSPLQSVQTNGSTQLVSVANTGSGLNVLQTSPSLTSPSLVTPDIGDAQGLDLTLTNLSINSSVQTDAAKKLVSVTNTGSGLNVMQTSPSLITPDIGAASGTSLSTTGNIETDQLLVSSKLTGTAMVINSTQESTSDTTGCAIFKGGIGVTKNIYADGTSVNVPNAEVRCDSVYAISSETATSSITGAVATGAGGIGTNDIYVASTTSATGQTTAAVKCLGGVGCKDVYVGSFVSATSTTAAAIKCQGGVGCTDLYVSDPISATSKTAATIKCQGGVGCKDVWVDDTTSATSKTVAAVKCQGGVGCEDLYVNTSARIPTITSLSSVNGFNFSYERGSFTPTLTSYMFAPTPTDNMIDTAWTSPTVNHAYGYYQKIGAQVLISVMLKYTIPRTGNAFADGTRIPAIKGLPFQCDHFVGVYDNYGGYSGVSHDVEYPDGRVSGVPSVITFNNPFVPTVYPAGRIVYPWAGTVIYPQQAPVSMDGYTILFNCTRTDYVLPTIPPFNEGASYWITPENSNIGVAFPEPHPMTFHFSLTYFTDQ